MTGRPIDRNDSLVAGFIALVVSLLFLDLLTGKNQVYLRDLFAYSFPMRSILREGILSQGLFPAWNPYFSGGQPLAANPAYGAFYPPNWLMLLPDPVIGFTCHYLFHVYLTAISMYFLLRYWKLGRYAALFGALSWGLGSPTLSLLNLLPMLFSLAWLPLVLLTSHAALTYRRPLPIIAAMVVSGLQMLVGEPTTLIQTWFLLALMTLWFLIRQKIRTAPAVLLLILLGGLLLSSAQMLPAIDHYRDTTRGTDVPVEELVGYSFPPPRLIELINPFFFGYFSDNGAISWWGRELYPQRDFPYLIRLSMGVLLLPLALTALGYRRYRIPFLVIALPLFLVAVGHRLPLYEFLAATGLPLGRFPEKYLVPILFATLILASIALDRIVRGDRKASRRTLLLLVIFTVGQALLVLFSGTDAYQTIFGRTFNFPPGPESTYVSHLSSLGHRSTLLFLILGTLVIALFRSSRHGLLRRTAPAALFCFLIFEIWFVSLDTVPRVESALYSRPSILSRLDPATNDYRLFHMMGWTRTNLEGLGPALPWAVKNGMVPRLPAAWGVRTAFDIDWDMTLLRPSVRLTDAMWQTQAEGQIEWKRYFLPISAVRYVTFESDPETAISGEDWWNYQPVELREVPHLPKAYLATELRRVATPDEMVASLVRKVPVPTVTFVESEPFRPGKGSVSLLEETWTRIVLNAETESESFLVISVTPHRYWKATVNGAPARLEPANIGYQGLRLPAGSSTIALQYHNPLVRAGLWISISTALALISLNIFQVARRRTGLDPTKA